MLSRLSQLSRAAMLRLQSALPTSCALCGTTHSEAICDSCNARHFGGAQSRCRCCAIPLAATAGSDAIVCGACLKNPPAYDATIVATDYAPPVDQLVLALKFGNRLALAPLLARMLSKVVQQGTLPLPDVLTPVPLGRMRLMERGFNQSMEIARPLSRTLRTRLDPQLVVRQRDTHAQALLHPDERHRNMRNAFVVPGKAIEYVRGRHIGIVDDVMTTGETLNELAATLKRFGAARVTNLVFARTC